MTHPPHRLRRFAKGALASVALKAFCIACAAWVCVVPVGYCITGDDASIVQLTRSFIDFGEPAISRFTGGLLFLTTQFIAIPFGLIIGLRVIWTKMGSPWWRGTLAGLSYGMWANTVFLSVPYIGGYPSIIGFGLLSLFGRSNSVQHFPLLLCNMIVSIFFGILFTLRFDEKQLPYRRRKLGLCQSCGYKLTGNESGKCPECGSVV